jgi:hypothetical protein
MDNPTDPAGRVNFDIVGSNSTLHRDNIVLIKEKKNNRTVTFAVQKPGDTPDADKIYLLGGSACVFCGIYYAAQPAHRSVCHNNTASFHS